MRADETLTPDPQRLWELLIARMPFGKYKGVRLLELPQAYLVWFSQKGFPPGKLGEQMAMALEIDHNGLRGLVDKLYAELRTER